MLTTGGVHALAGLFLPGVALANKEHDLTLECSALEL